MNRLQDTVRDRELAKAKEKLDQTKPENYSSETAYQAVLTIRKNRVRQLEKLGGR